MSKKTEKPFVISDELRIPNSEEMNDADRASIALANGENDFDQFVERVLNHVRKNNSQSPDQSV